jgi:hypothetical protein
LTTSVNSSEGGIVTPAGTNWFNRRQRVSVKAKPNEGYQFINWSGDTSESRNPINLLIEGPMNLVANFGKIGTEGVNNASGSMKPSNVDLPLIGELESPSEGKRVLGQKTIYGWALDSEGISRVRLFIDGEYVRYSMRPERRCKSGLVLTLQMLRRADLHSFGTIQVCLQASMLFGRGSELEREVLNLSANILVQKLSGEIITRSIKEWLIPGVNLAVDGSEKTMISGWNGRTRPRLLRSLICYHNKEFSAG